MKKRVAVLGAGPTGVAAAWKFAQQDLDIDLFEKHSRVGGLGGSVKVGKFTVDYGPHIFHVKKGEVYPLLKSIYDHDIVIVPRKTKMMINGKVYTYPFKFIELIFGLSPILSINIVISYIKQLFVNKFHPQPLDSFEAWGISRFGRVLYNLCFGNYSSKVWGIPTSQISPVLGQQKVVSKLSLWNFIKNMLGLNHEKDQFTVYQGFAYCIKGSGHFFSELEKSIGNMGARIFKSTNILRINMNNNLVKTITFEQNNEEFTYDYDYILSSIPLSTLVNLISPKPPQHVLDAANGLKYRALIFVYLVVNKKFATPAHWIYFLDKKFVFNRISEQKQFSDYGMNDEQSVVCMELCCNFGDATWKDSDEHIYEMCLDDVDKFNNLFFNRNDIAEYHIVRKNHVYPLFDIDYEKRLEIVTNYIDSIGNLISTGRNGLFVNNDMHTNMIYGIESAQMIANKFSNQTL